MIGFTVVKDSIISKTKIHCIEELLQFQNKISPSRKSFENYKPELSLEILWFPKTCTKLLKPVDYKRDFMLPSHSSKVPGFNV